MKKVLLIASLFWMVSSVSAVTYCASAPWGYGKSATGGGNVTPTLVSSESALKSALSSGNKVIIITQNISLSGSQIGCSKSNITLMALPGVKLISTKQTKNTSGILSFSGSNIILRNLTFEGPGAYDVDGNDNLTLSGAKNVWVDHCDFQDGMDGNFDINGKADNITVTWCRFRYLKAPKSGGSGGASDHRFTNLIGSDSSDKPADGTYNITYGYCWWDEGCRERMPRVRNASLHFVNCYWNSSVANYYIGPENADCRFEGCTFEGAPKTAKIFYQNYGGTNGSIYTNCVATKGLPSYVTGRTVASISYTYPEVLSAADGKTAVTNSTCGAGATLSVTSSAEVSSSCDSGEGGGEGGGQGGEGGGQGGEGGDPIIVDGDCCVSLAKGAEPSVANGGIPTDFAQLAITVNNTGSTWEADCFNMGKNADYITFDFSAYAASIEAVEFDVTIPNWAENKNTIAYHWNSNANTTYTISSSAKEMVRLNAPEGAKSFTIQRSAGTGTRISQVCFQIEGNEPTENIQPVVSKPTACKIVHEGRILIIRDGKTYDILGRPVR